MPNEPYADIGNCLQQQASGKARRVRMTSLGDRPQVPMLRLRGKWLQAAGFNLGDELIISVSDRKLVIVPANS
jgi:hypothetical protein